MDGIHDMGGMHGFGRVPIEDDYVFRADWQRRAFALVEALAAVAGYTADAHRARIERIPPVDYLRRDYFEKWIIATEELLKEAGLVDQAELEAGAMRFDVRSRGLEPIGPEAIVAAMRAGADLKFPDDAAPAAFTPGCAVRVRSDAPAGHSRAPRYVRGRVGTVVRDEGVFRFADAVAEGRGPCPRRCYTVAFAAAALWGSGAEERARVHVDLWEPYLEPA